MFAWLKALFRAHELPIDPLSPVRVDFVGRVLSPNTITSPITGFSAAVLEVALVDWERVIQPQAGMLDDTERDRFTALGAMRYGNALVIEDAAHRTFVIEDLQALKVFPLSARPSPLDVPAPRELADAARQSAHLLCYREVRFREGDAVRVVATVRAGEVAGMGGGYRDATMRTLVPVTGEPLRLYEML